MVKKNCSIFISGKGTNLFYILKNSREYNFPINIKLIISNKHSALGNQIAKKFKISLKFLNDKNILSLNKILNELKKEKISLICLAGYMSILPKYFINKFSGKIINIHPSLLPKYKGLNTFVKVIRNKEKRCGCTIHYVNEKLDSGKIIAQKGFYVKEIYNENTLKIKTQRLEHTLYSSSIIKIFKKN